MKIVIKTTASSNIDRTSSDVAHNKSDVQESDGRVHQAIAGGSTTAMQKTPIQLGQERVFAEKTTNVDLSRTDGNSIVSYKHLFLNEAKVMLDSILDKITLNDSEQKLQVLLQIYQNVIDKVAEKNDLTSLSFVAFEVNDILYEIKNMIPPGAELSDKQFKKLAEFFKDKAEWIAEICVMQSIEDFITSNLYQNASWLQTPIYVTQFLLYMQLTDRMPENASEKVDSTGNWTLHSALKALEKVADKGLSTPQVEVKDNLMAWKKQEFIEFLTKRQLLVAALDMADAVKGFNNTLSLMFPKA